jgi:hypothetical protein
VFRFYRSDITTNTALLKLITYRCLIQMKSFNYNENFKKKIITFLYVANYAFGIRGSHGSDYKDYCLLGCDGM